jgi:predicted pyridoxine 5'-phosphate oxidase superfamily flavin-nucleotide-binding protein
MPDFYGESHRALQDQFDSRRLADGLEQAIIHDSLSRIDKKFITASDMFFLSTLDHNGWPTVSHKGGFPGFVKILDDQTIAFPCYDGNGMHYSAGNIQNHAKIGLLFIDFVRPRRIRVHGTAEVVIDDPLLADYHEACMMVRVKIDNIFTNCGRYIHKYTRKEQSEYVPSDGTETPVAEWKRVEEFQEFLPERDKGSADQAGGTISEKEYRKDFWRGLD